MRRDAIAIGSLNQNLLDILSLGSGLFFFALFSRIAKPAELFALAVIIVHLLLVRSVLASGPAFGLSGEIAALASRQDYKGIRFARSFALVIQIIFTLLITAAVTVLLYFCIGLMPAMAEAAEETELLQAGSWLSAAVCITIGAETMNRGILEGLGKTRVCTISQLLNGIIRIIGLCFVAFHYHDAGEQWIRGFLYTCMLANAITVLYETKARSIAERSISHGAASQSRTMTPRKTIRSAFFTWFMPSCGIRLFISLGLLAATWVLLLIKAEDWQIQRTWIAYMQCATVMLYLLPVLASSMIGSEGYISLARGAAVKKEDSVRSPFLLLSGRAMYMAVPVGFAICVLAPQIMHVLFASKDPLLEQIVFLQGMNGMTAGWMHVLMQMMIVLQFGPQCVFYLVVGLVFKLIVLVLALPGLGLLAVFIADWVAMAAVIFLCLAKMHNRFRFSGIRTVLMLMKILAASMCMNGLFAALEMAGFGGLSDKVIYAPIQFALMLILGAAVYYMISRIMSVPQALYPSVKTKGGKHAA